jgi:hypothetical protein
MEMFIYITNTTHSQKHMKLHVCSHLSDNRFFQTGPKDAVSLIKGMLDPNPATRLGNTAKGWSAVTSHRFFNDINFDALLVRQIPAPFTPQVHIIYT